MATTEDVERLGALSRISINKDELPRLAKDFDNILHYISQLDELTLVKTSTPPIPLLRNVLRKEGTPNSPGMWTKVLTALFPTRTGNALSVKKILSHD